MKDYAKKSHRAQSFSNSNGKGLLIFLISCTVLFASYVAYHFTHQHTPLLTTVKKTVVKSVITHQKRKPVSHQKPIISAQKKKKIKEKTVALNPSDIQPKYDFYQLLPKLTVKIPPQQSPQSTQLKITPAAPN